MAQPAQPDRRRVAAAAGLVALLAWLPYLLLPGNPLLYDAPMAVLHNDAVQQGSIGELFAVDFWGLDPDSAVVTRSYRPLVSLTYWLQAQTVGNSPAVYHAVDAALHALVAALITLMLARLGLRRPWLIPSALIFAWHPLLTDAVCGVVGRADMMAVGAFAGALVLHLDARSAARPAARTAGAVALLGAAMLMKEYAVTFPFVLFAVDAARHGAGESPTAFGRGRTVWIGGLVMLGLYLALRLSLFGALGGVPIMDRDNHPLFEASLGVRWATAAAFVPLALRLLVAPFGLNHHYRMGTVPIAEGVFDPRAIFGALCVALLLALAVWGCRRLRSAAPAIAVALLLLPLGPSLNTISLAGVTFAERYLYLAVAGLALLIGRGLQRLAGDAGADARRSTLAGGPAARRALVGATLVLALAGAFLTARRVADWSSLERLARSSLSAYPEGTEVWKQLGLALQAQGRHEEAVDALGRSIELNEINAQAWKHYADSLGALGRHDEAVRAWQRTTELSPRSVWRLWLWRGDAERRAGRPGEAAGSYGVAHAEMPNDPRSLHGLVLSLLDEARPEDALIALNRGGAARANDPAAFEPLIVAARLEVARIRVAQRRPDEALALVAGAAAQPSIDPGSLLRAGAIAIAAGDADGGASLIGRALSADPRLLERQHRSALSAQEQGRTGRAEALFRDVLAARPDSAPTWFNLGRLLLGDGRDQAAADALRRGLELNDDPRARELLRQAESDSAGD